MIVKVVAGVVGALFASAPAFAQLYTAEKLILDCTSEQPEPKMYCAGYVHSFLEYDQALKAIGLLKTKYCIPAYITPRQSIAVFIKYAKENPKDWHLRALLVLIDSHIAAFPCPTR